MLVSYVESSSAVVHRARCLNISTAERRSSGIIYLLLTLPKEGLEKMFADQKRVKLTQVVLKRQRSRSMTSRRARPEQGWSGGCPEPPLLSAGIPGVPLIVGSATFFNLLSNIFLNIVLLSRFELNETVSSKFGSPGPKWQKQNCSKNNVRLGYGQANFFTFTFKIVENRNGDKFC